MIVYIENPIGLKKLLELKMSLARSQDTKSKYKNQMYIYTVTVIYTTCK